MKDGIKISRRNLIVGGLATLAGLAGIGATGVAGFGALRILAKRNERRVNLQNYESSNCVNIDNHGAPADPKLLGEAKPLYRIYNSLNGNNFYTMSSDERDLATQVIGKDRGIEGLIFDSQRPRTVPFHRLEKQVKGGTQYAAVGFYSFYTANEDEKRRAMQQGWKDKGVTGWIFSKMERGTFPLFRMRTIGKTMYLYTTDADEVRDLVRNSWWEYKGVAGYLYPPKEDSLQNENREFLDSEQKNLEF